MNRNAPQLFLTAFIAVAAALLSLGEGPVFAQANAPEAIRGAPQDWSHKHLLYTNPDTRDEAARKGTLAFEKWKQKNKDPRFALQVARKSRLTQAEGDSPFSPAQLQWANRHRRDAPAAGSAIHRDWSSPLGRFSGVGRAGIFPAKYSFDINATPSCANDFVVFTTASSGATDTPTTFASRTGTFTGRPNTGQTVTIGGSLVLTAGAANSGTTFARSTNTTTQASNLATVINFAGNGSSVGVSATSAGNVVTVTATVPGTGGNGITLAEAMNSFSWAGNALTGGSGTAGQPTIVAFNNVYSSCPATVPATFWSYNTGTAGFTETSPVLSLDGKQVAFLQRTGTVASLVVLKWSSSVSVGTVSAPTVPTSVTPANYRACTAPCMTTIAFASNPNNTNSSPYYVYYDDILFVGADNGSLHKFTGIFNGTPAEAGSPWPVTVSGNNLLSSPVYDPGTGLVYVGSDTGTNTGGQLHSVNATTGALVSSAQLAAYTIAVGGANTTGVRDAPVVDSAAQRVYAFVESDVVVTGSNCAGVECKAIYQFRTDLPLSSQTTWTASNKATIGRGQIAARVLYAGMFDNAYYNTGTGNLYVCGSISDTSTSTQPTLWKISISGSGMGAPVTGPVLVSATGVNYCSPITIIYNDSGTTPAERLYVSVNANGVNTAGGCSGTAGCIFMFDLSAAWGSGATAGFAAPGGTGGIIVDNISSTTGGASQIYYSTLTSPGNAIQASQAGLQ